MPPAARVTDPTSHPQVFPTPTGIITGPGVTTVLIGGLPAAVVGDQHACTLPPTLGGPHPPTPIIKGSAMVLIGGRPAARVGDTTACGTQILLGTPMVEIGG